MAGILTQFAANAKSRLEKTERDILGPVRAVEVVTVTGSNSCEACFRGMLAEGWRDELCESMVGPRHRAGH